MFEKNKNNSQFHWWSVRGEETNLSLSEIEASLNANFAIQKEFESRHLPPIPLRRFDGNPANWPEFIECFYDRVHSKTTFDDNIWMLRLLSTLDGDAKRAIEAISTSVRFYATALKALKRDFGNPLSISYLRLKNLFEKPQIKSNDRLLLRQYHQELKLTLSWLESIGYEVPIYSSENLTKAIMWLPSHIRQSFYKFTSNNDLIDGSVNLYVFEKWLEDKLKTFFNPLADIISDCETTIKTKFNRPKFFNNLSTNNDDESNVYSNQNFLKPSQNDKFLKCWLCSMSHRHMNCKTFLEKVLDQQ